MTGTMRFSKLISTCFYYQVIPVYYHGSMGNLPKQSPDQTRMVIRMLKMNDKCIDLSILCSKKVW